MTHEPNEKLTLSTLIERLQEIQAESGDLPVMIYLEEWGNYITLDWDTVSVETDKTTNEKFVLF